MPSSPRPAASPVRAASASHSRSLLMSGIFLKLLVLIVSIVCPASSARYPPNSSGRPRRAPRLPFRKPGQRVERRSPPVRRAGAVEPGWPDPQRRGPAQHGGSGGMRVPNSIGGIGQHVPRDDGRLRRLAAGGARAKANRTASRPACPHQLGHGGAWSRGRGGGRGASGSMMAPAAAARRTVEFGGKGPPAPAPVRYSGRNGAGCRCIAGWRVALGAGRASMGDPGRQPGQGEHPVADDVTKPGPMTSADAVHSCSRSRAARASSSGPRSGRGQEQPAGRAQLPGAGPGRSCGSSTPIARRSPAVIT